MAASKSVSVYWRGN